VDYGYVLTRAWKITWKYKILWLFGILTGCGSSSSNGSSNINSSQDANEMPSEVIEMGDKALRFLSQPAVIIGFILIVLLIIIIATFFTTIGRVGLISGTHKAETGVEKLGFGELFKDGTSRFWRFFGLNFLVSLPFMIVIFGLLGAGIFFALSAENAEIFLAGFIPTICIIFCCLLLFSLVVRMILQQAQNAMIIEDLGISASLIQGWEVFKKGLGHILLIAIILFTIGIMVGVAITLPVLAVVIPALFTFIMDGAKSAQPLIIGGLCLVAYFPVALIARGALNTYLQAVWTLTYLQLSEETPKIIKEDTIAEYA